MGRFRASLTKDRQRYPLRWHFDFYELVASKIINFRDAGRHLVDASRSRIMSIPISADNAVPTKSRPATLYQSSAICRSEFDDVMPRSRIG